MQHEILHFNGSTGGFCSIEARAVLTFLRRPIGESNNRTVFPNTRSNLLPADEVPPGSAHRINRLELVVSGPLFCIIPRVSLRQFAISCGVRSP